MAESIEITNMNQAALDEGGENLQAAPLTPDEQLMQHAHRVADIWTECVSQYNMGGNGYGKLSPAIAHLAEAYAQAEPADTPVNKAIGGVVMRLHETHRQAFHDSRGWNMLSPSVWHLRRTLAELKQPLPMEEE